jgi:multicomponent Na+:H+ antiporter subunit D
VVQTLLVLACARPPGLRDAVNVFASMAAAGLAVFLANEAAHRAEARIVLARPLPEVELAFALDPIGALMGAVVACLGVLHAIHTAGMLRAAGEPAPARLLAFMALCMGGALAVAYADNLFTLFVAYQILSLAAFPLVEHHGAEAVGSAGRVFLAVPLISSIGLFLPAMVWTYSLAGALDFRAAGVLVGQLTPLAANVLLPLFVFGVAMAGAAPTHRWISLATAAPNPALTSILALTMLPAGGVGIVKIAAFVFGPSLIQAAVSAQALIALCGAGMCVAALLALSKQNLHERLAYSCLAQALAVVLGVLLALPTGYFAAALQLVALSCSAATLLMAVGTVSAVTDRIEAASYAGLGRVMPWTLASFAIASASMIGLPPFAGAWAKLWLIVASAGASFNAEGSGGDLVWAAVLVGVSAVLTFAHLGPLAAGALSGKAPTDPFKRPDGASFLLVVPVVLGAVASLSLLVFADPLATFLSPIWASAR